MAAIIKLQKIVHPEFIAGCNKLGGCPLSAKQAYALARMMKTANTELTAYNSARALLIKRFGSEKDGQWTVDPKGPRYPEFAAAMGELLDQEVEVYFTEKIRLPLSDALPQFTPFELLALEDFFELYSPEDEAADKPSKSNEAVILTPVVQLPPPPQNAAPRKKV